MRVRSTSPCFIVDRLYPAGSEFEYSGPLADFMEPVGERAAPKAPVVTPSATPAVPIKRGPGRPRKHPVVPVSEGAPPQA